MYLSLDIFIESQIETWFAVKINLFVRFSNIFICSSVGIAVSGINIAKKHTKPNNQQAGGIIDKEMPIQVSNVAYYDKDTKKGIRIGYSFLKDGTKVRVNKKNNKEL